MFKRIISALFLVVLICSGCGKKEEETAIVDDLTTVIERNQIIIGVKTDTPPFGYLDKDGKNIGFDIDLAKLITKKLLKDESKVKFVPVTPANRIMKLSANEVDMVIATMSVTPNRRVILNFSVPYHTAGQAIMVLKESKLSSLNELNGKKAIIVFGSTVEKNLRTNVPNITIIGYKTYPEAVAALKQGKADAMIADDTILMGFAMNDSSLKILPRKYSKEPYAVAFRKTDESQELLKAVNLELKESINRGEIKQLKAKWGIN